MLTVDDRFPDFELTGVESSDPDTAFRKVLADLPFPMLADVRRDLCASLGVLSRTEGVALRATFVVDPNGVIRHVAVNDLDVGRDPGETLRVLLALQTGELTPCAWAPGQARL